MGRKNKYLRTDNETEYSMNEITRRKGDKGFPLLKLR